MSEQKPNETINVNIDAVKDDPEFKQFQATKKAKQLIAEYEKDDTMKVLLDDGGLRDVLQKKPEVVLSQDRLADAIEFAKEKALLLQKTKQVNQSQQNTQVAQNTQNTHAPIPPEKQKTIASASLKEIENETHSISSAVDLKVFGRRSEKTIM